MNSSNLTNPKTGNLEFFPHKFKELYITQNAYNIILWSQVILNTDQAIYLGFKALSTVSGLIRLSLFMPQAQVSGCYHIVVSFDIFMEYIAFSLFADGNFYP